MVNEYVKVSKLINKLHYTIKHVFEHFLHFLGVYLKNWEIIHKQLNNLKGDGIDVLGTNWSKEKKVVNLTLVI